MQAVELAFYYKSRELQPGCTRGSAARRYKRKCSQAVELAFYYKSRELQLPFLIEGQFYTAAWQHFLLCSQDALSLVCTAWLHFLLFVQPGCTSLCAARL